MKEIDYSKGREGAVAERECKKGFPTYLNDDMKRERQCRSEWESRGASLLRRKS